MVFEFVLGFLLLVVASYVGTTMALRGFFGREYYDSPFDDGESDGGGGDGGVDVRPAGESRDGEQSGE